MRLRYLFILTALGIASLWYFYKDASYFPPFEHTQIHRKSSPRDLINFKEKMKKSKWKKVRHIYYSKLSGHKKPKKTGRIPKIIHQIWLEGPLPDTHVAVQESWKRHHPDWEYHLWTQDQLDILYLPDETQELRFEILNQFGGVFVNWDMICLKPIDILVEHCDFFTGLDATIDQPKLKANLIGASPSHPILQTLCRSPSNEITEAFFNEAKQKNSANNIALPYTYFYPSTPFRHSFTRLKDS